MTLVTGWFSINTKLVNYTCRILQCNSSSSKRFRPSTALKKVGRKFTKFDDDLHEYMAQDERESKYEDTIFDSDEDSDGFEPKSKQKPKKKKSTKKSV